MSRWIALGLKTGVRTTPFPEKTDPGAANVPTAVTVSSRNLVAGAVLAAARQCPTGAIKTSGSALEGTLEFDLGLCVMCGRCSRAAPDTFQTVNDPEVAVRSRSMLRTSLAWDGHEVAITNGAEPGISAAAVNRTFRRSLHIRHVDAGSSNATESELQLLSSPAYDLNRLGLFFTPTPRHADALLVTGVVTRQMVRPLLETYEAMPAPKVVIAAGTCAISGGLFQDSLTHRGPLEELLPVDVFIPGSPPSPLALLHGLLLAVGKAEERFRVLAQDDGT
ncbi:MAG: NADH:ubiquinone oxidoreductase [Candidatus Dormibacteraeota bacterium]|nr:NADH:ubiquinone oxidoreductase [Candidatus Dormibacteraeota bacterium]